MSLQALVSILMFLTAVSAAYIAWQQHRTSKLQYRAYLFGQRMQVFLSARSFMDDVCRDASTSAQRLIQFRRETAGAEFLFGDDREVLGCLDEIYNAGVELEGLCNELYPARGQGLAVGPERTKASQRKAELLIDFTGALRCGLRRALRRHLTLP